MGQEPECRSRVHQTAFQPEYSKEGRRYWIPAVWSDDAVTVCIRMMVLDTSCVVGHSVHTNDGTG